MGDEDEHFLAVATTAVAAEAAPQTRLSSSAVLLSVGLDNSPIFSDFSPKPHKYLSSFIALAFEKKKYHCQFSSYFSKKKSWPRADKKNCQFIFECNFVIFEFSR